VHGRGWCTTHHKRWLRHGDPLVVRQEQHRGNGTRRADGYVLIYAPHHPLANVRGRVLAHRLIAWNAGLFDDPALVVHHRNGDPTDNRIENLEVMTLAEHNRLHHGGTS
jgi:hypothetical protein